MRSNLWLIESQIVSLSFPTMGKMINDQLAIDEPAETQEKM
ncbi:hypothetical protein O1D97_04605 [Marinomonas sp. 15G1-11]|uniref:Uncharacterized protein n=1 Tax=Marinomonas phaeophyticola TaxID=3004091 RepID=A0ABT4JTL7_9GAMM|nr:hypothetical protein [Marinomonas sp. 15G1-11]MCZ2720944.1 hypothetical protein [Marinomonas sp. 15G1-11]